MTDTRTFCPPVTTRALTSAGLPWPRLTIVTPSYQSGEYLEATVRAILGQGYPNLEYMILDGGSTDNTPAVLEHYCQYLGYWRSGPDAGHYAAVNEGFARATGDILCWLNADDLFFPGALHLVGDLFAARPDINWLTTLVRGGLNREGECFVRRSIGVSAESLLDGRHLPDADDRFYGFVQQESTFFRRELWQAVGGLRPGIGLAADFALWLDFARVAPVHAVDRLLGAFRSHDRNLSRDRARYLASAHAALAEAREASGWRPSPLYRMRRHVPNRLRRPLRRVLGYRTAFVRRGAIAKGNAWEVEFVPYL